ncbi:GAF domain-containing protein [Lysobacter sp. A3-1-A15]|uniref:GAF domain-containing protein n=1 Tax=Novilysobacter viscosus TaxID=3098602 RepID=UPI00398316EE
MTRDPACDAPFRTGAVTPPRAPVGTGQGMPAAHGPDTGVPDTQSPARAIQPHGYLVSVVLPDWSVRQASANIDRLLEVPAADLLGTSLADYINQDVLDVLADTVGLAEADAPPQRAGVGNIGAFGVLCDLAVHVADGLVHIEIEPQHYHRRGNAPTGVAQAMIARVAAAGHADDFHQRAVQQVRQLTGYDRVMVYRFREDGTGDVVAEAIAPGMAPFVGLRYPASLVPPQACALLLRNRLRVIPDAGYVPVPVVPGRTPAGEALDMSQHALGSVSSKHLAYLRDIGVGASLTISIVSGGRLWGLIACHHREPRPVPSDVRAAADLFGMFVSMRVAAREQADTLLRYEQAQQVRDAVGSRLSQARDFQAALTDELALLRRTLDSDGAALWLAGEWSHEGHVPGALDIAPLMDWVQRAGRPALAMTGRRSDWNTDALQAGALAGLLAINLGTPEDWLFVFRCERVEQIRWAGAPADATGSTAVRPGTTHGTRCAEWPQTVHGCSADWTAGDLRAAERLQRVLREQRRRLLAPAGDRGTLERLRLHQSAPDRTARLQHLSGLADGLPDLDASQAARLDQRIAALEADLRQLAQSRADDLRSSTP